MKYIITESQHSRNVEHLKEPMFRYWDMNGGKDYKTAMKLFSLPPASSTLVEDWLLEWMGGEEEVLKMLRKYEGRVMNGNAGTYDFKFYLDGVRMYTHGGVEIYFDAIVDGDGDVQITVDDRDIIDNVYDAHLEEDIGWEVDSEIRDTIVETLDMVIPIEFNISIDQLKITPPGKFNS